MNRPAAILTIILFTGCSTLRHTADETRAQTDRVERRDVETARIEKIDIEIPAPVWWAAAASLPYPPGPDSIAYAPALPADTPPVRVAIDRRTDRTERIEADEQTHSETQTETRREVKPRGLFGFWGGVAFAFAVTLAAFILLRRARIF